MKRLIIFIGLIFITSSFLSIAQEVNKKELKDTKTSGSKLPNETQATGDDVKIKDESDNILFRVIDEGSFGSIEIPIGVPSTTTNKLYNNSGTLHFNGSALGSGGARKLDDLSDAKYINYSLYLGEKSGMDDSGTDYNYNLGIGWFAMASNSGSQNIAIGEAALRYNTGDFNTAIGYHSLFSSSMTGNYNTAIGSFTIASNTSGSANTAVGYNALSRNRNSINNTAIGFESLYNNSSGWSQAALGYQALYNNTSGIRNTAVGEQALYSNKDGDYNTAVGNYALNVNTTGNGNTTLGYSAGPTSNNLSNTTAIGYNTTVDASNQVRIGNSSITSIGGYEDWTNISDIRYKQNIKEDVSGLRFIMDLRPITYNLNINAIAEKLGENIRIDENGNPIKREIEPDVEEAREKKILVRKSGFAAQEVEELVNRLRYDFGGIDKPQNENSFYGLRYAEFVVPLVKAVQEQQEMITGLESVVAKLQSEVDALKSGLAK